MALNSNDVAKKISDEYEILKDGNFKSRWDFLNKIVSKKIDEGFQKGTVSMKNVDITTPANTFNIPPGEGIQLAINIGLECARYWSQTIMTSGQPQVESSIISVVNDATKISSPITSKLISLSNRRKLSEPFFNEFVKIIYDEVKTIKWVVTEITPGKSPTTLTVTIS